MKNLFWILLFIIIGCKSESNTSSHTIQQWEVSIPVDDYSLPNYDVFHVSESEGLFVGYNHTTHALDIFSLVDSGLLKRIQLEWDGPKLIGPIGGVFYHNKDSIFSYTRGHIQLFDIEYSNVKTFNLYEFTGENTLNFDPIVDHNFRLHYIPELKAIPFYNNYFGGNNNYEKDKSLVSLFYLDEKRFELMPFYHTEPIDGVNCFGFLNSTNLSTVNGTQAYVNNQYSGATYLLDFKTVTSKQVLKGEKSPRLLQAGQKKEQHAMESTFYFSLEKLNEKHFARLLWIPEDYIPNENGFLHKKLSLQVFDTDLKLVDAKILEEKKFSIFTHFNYQDKIFLQYGHPKNEQQVEEKLSLIGFSFN